MLKQYFENIAAACNNKEVDERPYIKDTAECGLSIINGLYNDKKPYV